MEDILEPAYKGSPARAGIGPNAKCTILARHWFPRASGDRPYDHAVVEKLYPVPPRERG